MSPDETFVALVSAVVTFVGWRRWYARLNHPPAMGRVPAIRPVLLLLPGVALLGILAALAVCLASGATGARALTVSRPSRFRELGYRAAVLVGLLRDPAGGFGARVPHPSSSG